MGILGRVIVVAALSAACSGSEPAARGVTGQRISPRAVPHKVTPKAVAVSPYDEHGNLKPSGMKVGWLEIPAGFQERVSSQGTHHAYVGKVKSLDVTRFFDARVFTSQVRLVGHGVHYGLAQPKNQDPNAVRLEIGVYPNRAGDTVQIFVDERTQNAGPPLTMEQARALLSERQSRAE